MSVPLLDAQDSEVSPLELFFDLVFVFAVSQLSAHLATDLTWVGTLQTAALLCASFSIWAFSSFGVIFSAQERVAAASIFAVLFLALFINAGIPHAFLAHGLSFVVPFLVARLGQVVQANLTAATEAMRLHHRAVLVWVTVECGLWAAGATVSPTARLGWWVAAATVSVVGYWTAHPLPGMHRRSDREVFAAGRMVERSRLLLLIALGETVLSIGTAVSGAPLTAVRVAAALLALVLASLLWSLYFVTSDPVVNAATAAARDSLRVARLAVNTQLVVLAGLIAVSVGAEAVIDDPWLRADVVVAVTLHTGVALYLGAQTKYLRALSGQWSRPRLIGVAAVVVSTPVSAASPALVGLVVVCTITASIVVTARSASSTGFPGTRPTYDPSTWSRECGPPDTANVTGCPRSARGRCRVGTAPAAWARALDTRRKPRGQVSDGGTSGHAGRSSSSRRAGFSEDLGVASRRPDGALRPAGTIWVAGSGRSRSSGPAWPARIVGSVVHSTARGTYPATPLLTYASKRTLGRPARQARTVVPRPKPPAGP